MKKNSSIAFDLCPLGYEHDRYELHFQLIRANITVKGILEIRDMLDISFDDVNGTYTVCNLDGSEAWYGADPDKNKAILKYLARRLALEDEKNA